MNQELITTRLMNLQQKREDLIRQREQIQRALEVNTGQLNALGGREAELNDLLHLMVEEEKDPLNQNIEKVVDRILETREPDEVS